MNALARVAVFVCAFALSSHIQAQEPAWAGVFVNEAQSDEGIEAAIETAVAKMNFITRSIARSRLKKTNPAYKRVGIGQKGDVISVQFDDREPIDMPADGRPIKWTRDDGEVFDVSARIEDGELIQTFKAEDGQRVNTFSTNAQGQMTMEAQITSPQLTTPVIYTLLFERSMTDAGAVAP